jgi:hypothetical protein
MNRRKHDHRQPEAGHFLMKRRSLSAVTLFDVVYMDGSRSSHRKVPNTALDSPDGDDTIKAVIEAQDRDISISSGRPRGPIRTLSRSRI